MDRRQAVVTLGSGLAASVGLYGLYDGLGSPASRGQGENGGKERGTPGNATSSPRRETPADATREGQTLLGMTLPKVREKRLERVDEWTGVPNATVVTFANLGWSAGGIDQYVADVLDTIWAHGAVPHVVWQPYLATASETPGSIPADIAAGAHDDLVERWATRLSNWLQTPAGLPDRRLYLNFAPEMNGDWVPWGGADGESTAVDFAAMWRHVYDRVMATGLDGSHVRWVWTANNASRDDEPIDAYYPGDDYVDWLGVHGYNWDEWGGWSTPEDIFSWMLGEVRSVADKPVTFSECGCSSSYEGSYHPDKKGAWIEQLYDYAATEDVRMVCWFNIDAETDWAVFGGKRGTASWSHEGKSYPVYPAYRRAVGRDRVLPAHPDHPRRLTDAEFAGKLG